MGKKSSLALRIVGVILMSLTAVFNILGGLGTVCAAFLTEQYPSMKELLGYQWLYQLLMILTIIIGVYAVWMSIRLVSGGRKVYRKALIVLGVGTLLGGIHVIASLMLRGKAVPANMKLYITGLTLLYFLMLRIPAIFERIELDRPMGKKGRAAASGTAAILAGILMLTVFAWAGPSHTFEGNNWVNVLRTPLIIGGSLLLLGGGSLIFRPWLAELRASSAETNPLQERL